MKKILVLALVVTISTSPVMAYDIPNHFDMSKEAAKRSVLQTDPNVLLNLGLKSLSVADQVFLATDGENSTKFTDECKHSLTFPIDVLIGCGAQFEDVPGNRSLNHFYDPINNSPLKVRIPPKFGPFVTMGFTSPDWGLEDNIDNTDQAFSYKDARLYFYQALVTEGVQKNRDALWGKLFQSIGQVIHHVQDMAQPQHVRNDQHVDKFIPGYYNPSLYEIYTSDPLNRPGVLALFSLSGSEPAYSGNNPGAFKMPRDFWKNNLSTGLAEFTNRNFVSDGTNFKLYQGQPVVGATYDSPMTYGPPQNVPASELLPPLSQEILTSCSANPVSVCTMSFYTSNGPDVVNPRASALSIFDQYVQLKPLEYGDPFRYVTDRLFTLNRYTFNTAHSLLIPKAVGYSTGLINYFFRGKMEISLPDEGIYGIIDHSDPVSNKKDTGGFNKIKLKLKNVTPNGTGIELMAATGKLIAVAKFHRNTCYTPNLSGEYGSPGIDWRACRAKDEEIVDSEVIETTPIGINTDATQLTFNFKTPIPINATDLYLQVVYKGLIGAETEGVAVVTKDISEPHYIYSDISRWDQYAFGSVYPNVLGTIGGKSWADWCATGYPTQDACNQGMGWTVLLRYSGTAGPIPGYDPFDPTFQTGTIYNLSEARPFPPVSTMPDPLGPDVTMPSPVGSFSRVAVLTDVQPSNTVLSLKENIDTTHDIALFQWFTGVAATTINQRDPTNDTLTPTTNYLQARGVYVRAETVPLLMSGTAPQPFPDLKILPSQINF